MTTKSLTPTKWRTSILALLMLTAPGMAHADVIVAGNLGDSRSFDPNNGWGVDGGAVAGQWIAAQFSTQLTGMYLTGVELPLGLIFSTLATDPIDVYVAGDAAGLPGADLADLTLAPGDTVGSFPPGNLVTYGCRACLVLQPATLYWVVVGVPNTDNDHFLSQASWNWNFANEYATGSDFAFNDTQYGSGWQLGDSTVLRPAFQVDAVPEPGSLVLIGLGLAGLSVWTRGKRRRL